MLDVENFHEGQGAFYLSISKSRQVLTIDTNTLLTPFQDVRFLALLTSLCALLLSPYALTRHIVPSDDTRPDRVQVNVEALF